MALSTTKVEIKEYSGEDEDWIAFRRRVRNAFKAYGLISFYKQIIEEKKTPAEVFDAMTEDQKKSYHSLSPLVIQSLDEKSMNLLTDAQADNMLEAFQVINFAVMGRISQDRLAGIEALLGEDVDGDDVATPADVMRSKRQILASRLKGKVTAEELLMLGFRNSLLAIDADYAPTIARASEGKDGDYEWKEQDLVEMEKSCTSYYQTISSMAGREDAASVFHASSSSRRAGPPPPRRSPASPISDSDAKNVTRGELRAMVAEGVASALATQAGGSGEVFPFVCHFCEKKAGHRAAECPDKLSGKPSARQKRRQAEDAEAANAKAKAKAKAKAAPAKPSGGGVRKGSFKKRAAKEAIVFVSQAGALGAVTRFPEKGIVDSGANQHCSGKKEHFKLINWNAPIRIRVADRLLPKPGYKGLFRDNSCQLVLGVYHPEFADLLVSVSKLEEDCAVVIFDGVEKERRIRLVDGTVIRMNSDRGLPVVEVDFTNPGDVLCQPVQEVVNRPFTINACVSRAEEDMRVHLRNGHFHIPGVKVNCPQCNEAKGQDKGAKPVRPDHLQPGAWMDSVDWDFVGPFLESYMGNRQLLNSIETFFDWCESYPVKSRDKAADVLRRYCHEVGVPKKVHSDNAREFKELNCKWKKFCAANNPPIQCEYTAPYTPWRNGKCERLNRSIVDAVRTNLRGVDPKVWDYCAKYCAWVFNRLDRRKNKSPFFRRYGREPSKSYFRRFGCEVWAKVHTQRAKLTPKYERGIFLGYAPNSTYLVGVWRKDTRTTKGERFTVIENRAVKFNESSLISDVKDLKSPVYGPLFKDPDTIPEAEEVPEPEVVPDQADQPNLDTPLVEGTSSLPAADGSPLEGGDGGVPPELRPPVPGQMVDPHDDRTFVDPDGVVRRKRGRPKGSKNRPKEPAAKASAKAKAKAKAPKANPKAKPKAKQASRKRTRAQRDALDAAAMVASVPGASIHEFWEGSSWKELEEEVLCYSVQMTRKEVMSSPDVAKWIEADTLERVQLESLTCWRPLNEQDGFRPGKDEAVPCVVIYTKKRPSLEHPEGRYKARCVALGNRQRQPTFGEIYSPVCSLTAHRMLLTHAAASSFFVGGFDISNAFIRAALKDERIFLRLPPHWSESPKGDIVRLLKSLYGLKLAPRAWFDEYSKALREMGWNMCEREPGLFRKDNMFLSIYVDDSLIAGPCRETCEKEMKEILTRFEGKIIPPEIDADGIEIRDILGATVRYSREKRICSWSMENYIDKLLSKFNMVDCKPVVSPCVPNIYDEESTPNESFPLRSLVGGLQYVASVCRPDISWAVNRVARMQSNPTEASVRAAKRILAYLKGSRTCGPEYSPELEKSFREVYEKVCAESGKTLSQTVAFSDADWAGCTQTLRSTSGAILYHRGCPIAWSSRRQSCKALSTCESEYIAGYDCVRLVMNQGYLDFFRETRHKFPIVMIDNKSAIDVARSSLITKRSKHIDLRYHVLKDHSADLCYVPTDKNLADPLTKALQSSKYLTLFAPHKFSTPTGDEGDCEVQAVDVVGADRAVDGDVVWESECSFDSDGFLVSSYCVEVL